VNTKAGARPVIDGVLVIDKPEGPTSHTIVSLVRRTLRVSRVGHTGTLDPFATGVLPLVIGRATRLAQFLASADKTYDATLRLGWATDTYDRTGTPVGDRGDGVRSESGAGGTAGRSKGGYAGATVEQIEQALEQFRGTLRQTPPSYSAKMIDGVRSYELARRNRAVSPSAVTVTAYDLTLLEHDAERIRLMLRCSAGFYVRSLAHDLGTVLGCGAHLESLRRLRSGEFTLDDAVAAEDLAGDPERALSRIIPMDRLLPDLPSARVTGRGLDRVRHGNPVQAADLNRTAGDLGPAGRLWRLCGEAGQLLAIGRAASENGQIVLHPFLVLGRG
jgi:tRNA pseudouridine55 synthase